MHIMHINQDFIGFGKKVKCELIHVLVIQYLHFSFTPVKPLRFTFIRYRQVQHDLYRRRKWQELPQ